MAGYIGTQAVSVNTTSATITGDASIGGDLSLGDSDKAIFGAGSDLQIYHDGTHSYVDDAGTGRLILRGNDRVMIQKYTGEDMISCLVDGAVKIYHNNAKKIETTAAGVAITGGFEATAPSTISHSGNGFQLRLTSTDADASVGPALDLYRNSGSPANNDFLGNITFRGRNNNSQDVQYAETEVYVTDVADGAEDGLLNFNVITNGTNISYLQMRGETGTVVINEDSNDLDFRVESNNHDNLFFIDGGHDGIGIGNSTIIDWSTNYPGLQMGQAGVLYGHKSSNQMTFGMNWGVTTGNVFIANGIASRMVMDTTKIAFDSSASGSAAGAITGIPLFDMTPAAGSVFNRDRGGVLDFRVASGSKNHMFFVDSSTDRISIGASTNPSATVGIFATASNEPVLRLAQGTNSAHVTQRYEGKNSSGTQRYGDVEFDPDERMLNFRPIWNGVNYVQVRSNGGSLSANLTVNPTNNVAYVHSINAFAPQLTAGNRNIMAIGQAGATGNAAIIGYKDSDTTANCKLIMSMWGAGDLFTMTNAGNVVISGSLSKGSGSFKIDHPLEAKKDTHHLVHSFIEGPQADNIYRGKVNLSSGSASVNIDTVAGMTDGTFAALNREVQCFTTNESGWTAIKGSVSGNVLTITAQENSCTDTISWMVIGERKDPHMMSEATTWTDSQGKIIIEPEKEEEDETSGWP